jgi:hypothetical protein
MTTKTTPSADIESALDKCESIQTALAKEEKLLRDSTAEQNSLQKTIDISDPVQLQRMATLLTIAQVGGPRRTYRHQERETALKALRDLSQSFLSKTLAPRLRDMEARALAKVEGKLKQHFPEEDALRSAANHSTELSALARIRALAVIDDYGIDEAMRQAKRLLEVWKAADAFEQQHLS